MKRTVLALTRALVRLFYRRIEVAGLEYLPREGPVLLAANHTNGLVDPMVVLAALPRPVVFVAKSTLWKVPLLRSILDLLGCVPVVRRGEEEPGSSLKGGERNRGAFERLAGELGRSGCVLIFPEGRSHSDPRLSEMRTGAARVLLLSERNSPVVLPLGLWFTKKEEFRSDVLVTIGPPLGLSPCPPEAAVETWTKEIGAALEAVTLNAGSWRDHEVARAVDALYGEFVEDRFLEGEEGTAGDAGPLERSLRIRQLLLSARASLETAHSGEVARLARRALALDHLLRKISLSFSSLDSPPSAATVAWHTFKAVLVIVLGFPVAVLGVVAWWVPYRLTGVIANRAPGAREHKDQIALYKLLAGCILFPVFLLVECAAVWAAAGPLGAGLAAFVLPFAGISSLKFLEYASWREGQLRDLLALAFAPRAIARLRAERDTLVEACDRLAERATGLTSR